MRTLKFRGYSTERKEWFYGYLVYDFNQPYIVGRVVEANEEYINFERWEPVDPKSVGQFTGLRDKNGKEIFEGDIVKHQWNGCEEEGPFIVESLEWAYIENRNEKNGKLTCISEIIGNIYENPSLLKDTQHE